jgi:hypothetical protein
MKDQLTLDGKPIGEIFKFEITEVHKVEQNLDGAKKETTDKVKSEGVCQEQNVNLAIGTFFEEYQPKEEDWDWITIKITRKDPI